MGKITMLDVFLKEAIIDYFSVSDFAEYIGVTVDDLITAFPDEVDDALEDLKELMEYENVEDNDD